MTPSRDALPAMAEEYVLGLLDPQEVEAFEAHLADDRDLQLEVAAARAWVLELDLAEPAIAPSPRLWTRIEAAIEQPEVGLPGARVRAPLLPATRRPRPGVNRWWRPVGLAGALATVLLAVILGWRILAPPEPLVVAVLLDADGAPVALVEDFGNERARVVPLTDIDLPAGRALEVWTLPDPDAGPVSLGLLQQASGTTLLGPELPPPASGQLYEITIEPETGSPTGGPTGRIVGKGFARVPR